MSKRKLNILNLEQKLNLIRDFEKHPNVKKKDFANKYGIPPSTLCTILKSKETILGRHQASVDPKCRRLKTCAFPDVESALLKWYESRGSLNSSNLSGTMLREKAVDFARLLNVEGFNGSSGWLEKFKARHNIAFRTLRREGKDVPDEACEKWRNEDLPKLLAGHDANDVFNIVETGLFYKCLPNKTVTFKGESCSSGKKSKERLTVVVGANASGTEKLPLLVIGKFENPGCLKNAKSLPVQYESNKDAWITPLLFEKYIRTLDSMFYANKRKVLIFIDNCTAHCELTNLKSIELKFLPADTGPKVQPADQGIVKNLKHSYRKRLVRKVVDNVDGGMNLLEAIRLLSSAWNNDVKQSTIENCFKRCGFFANDASDDQDVVDNECLDVGVSVDAFMNIDEKVVTCERLSDADIVNAIKEEHQDDSDEEETPIDHFLPPSNYEATTAIGIVQQYLESRENVDMTLFLYLQKLNDFVTGERRKSKKQSKITNFFASRKFSNGSLM